LNPQDEDSATVEINTADMEHKTWDGIFKIKSNGGIEDISVIVKVPRTRHRFLLAYNLFEIIQSEFPLLFIFLNNL
jgi:hypothetical protein